MITDLEAILYDTHRTTADKAVDMILENPEIFELFYDACFLNYGKLPMRASRVVGLVSEKKPEFILPKLNDVVNRLPKIKDKSVIRIFLKLISTHPMNYDEQQLGFLIKYCLLYL